MRPLRINYFLLAPIAVDIVKTHFRLLAIVQYSYSSELLRETIGLSRKLSAANQKHNQRYLINQSLLGPLKNAY